MKKHCAPALRIAAAFALVSIGIAGRANAQPKDIEVRTSLSKTAVWVADRVTYTITIACNKGVDILADDLSKDKLRLDGLEVVGSEVDRTSAADDRTVYTFRYALTTYRVDAPELKIAPVAVRYYVKRTGQRLGESAPAGELQVPGAVVAFRSALPDGQQNYAIRDGREPAARRLRYAWLRPIGTALIVISIVPVGVAALAIARRGRQRATPRSARQVRRGERERLEALQALDLSTPAARRDAYSRVNMLVRDHLRAVSGIDAAGLTAGEVQSVLGEHDGGVPLDLAARLLGSCDEARYAPPDRVPSADACRQAIDQAAQVLGLST